MSRPVLTDRDALVPVAALLVSLILLVTTVTLMAGGWRTLAAAVALASLPVATFGVASTAWVLLRMLEAMAELRKQRAELERQQEVQDGGEPS
jgi:TRAP-type C4-dicarboxylate transport system permease small subunit